ncbi:MAG TPA: efflux RND transporter periplasmic adaptor subunit [Polyangiaceae bacterium]|nr:efflux RND transporter periplasmic adaptor subunit [Polyangiaceae bacterium]
MNSEQTHESNDGAAAPDTRKTARAGRALVPLVIGVGVLAIIAIGATMVVHAEAQVNKVALDQSAKPVTVIEAAPSTFRPERSYVGTLEPWVEAKVGPQMISAYVDTVLVRPGAVVKRGEVVATLDCRNANASSQAVAMQARALEARQEASAHEASRLNNLLDGGFVSPNEAEQKTALSAAEQAQLLAAQAQLVGSSLQQNDCILRAPFDGEIATRTSDPGAFARPGVPIVSVVDRSTVRVVADAPEVDFSAVAPGTPVNMHMLSTDRDLSATISRRAPAADPLTRTVHFEMDVADPERALPVGTTADIRIDVGEPKPATEIPLSSALVRGDKATVFVVDGNVAHKRVVPVLGERTGRLFVAPSLASGTKIVTEGRALLNDNDKVNATLDKRSTP